MDSTDVTLQTRVPDDTREPMKNGALGDWWGQGARSALLMRVRWQGLQLSPAVMLALVLTPALLQVLVERLYIAGPASFFWPALESGWLTTVVSAFVCWLLVPQADADAPPDRPQRAAALFAMLEAQALTVNALLALLFVPLVRAGMWSPLAFGRWGFWLAWGLPFIWIAAAQGLLVWRSSPHPARQRAGAIVLMIAAMGASQWLQPAQHWYPDVAADADAQAQPRPSLGQADIEAQLQVASQRLGAIASQRAGTVDVYAITFAPYAEEDVFLRESALVAGVIESRFDATGRALQLVNHRSTTSSWPWATPLNLERAIRRMAERMDRDEDVLFIHLTSHGARSGALSASFWPLDVDPVTPQALKGWLDAAGVKHRIVSVSACYSGSWIEPLADEHTLVMTAADAEHTSYGCGRGSELTYFGRAMYDEQLRKNWSFEAAHAQARTVIEQREREAGKSDGYSNPQIRVGSAIRVKLAVLESQRAQAAR